MVLESDIDDEDTHFSLTLSKVDSLHSDPSV